MDAWNQSLAYQPTVKGLSKEALKLLHFELKTRPFGQENVLETEYTGPMPDEDEVKRVQAIMTTIDRHKIDLFHVLDEILNAYILNF